MKFQSVLLGVCLMLSGSVFAADAGQAAINTLQQQIQANAAACNKAVADQQAQTQKAMSDMQAQVQSQINHLQSQMQAMQDQLSSQIKQVQAQIQGASAAPAVPEKK